MTGDTHATPTPSPRSRIVRALPVVLLVALSPTALAQTMPAVATLSFWQRHQLPLLLGGVTLLFTLALVAVIYLGRRRLALAEGDAVEMELRWSAALDRAGLGLWDWRPNADTAVFSAHWARLLDHRPEDISGSFDAWRERLHPEDRDQAVADLDHHLNGALGNYKHLQRLQTKGGGWRWFLNRAAIMDRAEDGTPLRVIGTLTDITRFKATEQALQDQQALFSAVFMPARDGIVLIDPSTLGFVQFNDAAARALGYSRDEFAKLRLSDIQLGEPNEVLTQLRALLKAGGGAYHTQHRDHKGTARDVRVVAHVVPRDGKRLLAAIWADDTERNWAATALRDAEMRFRVTFEQTAFGMAHLDLDGRMLRVNSRLCELLGRGRKSLIKEPFQALLHPDDRAPDDARRAQLLDREITQYHCELRLLNARRQPIWTGLTMALVRKADGTPLYFVLVVEDIDARRRASDALETATARHRELLRHTSDGVLVLRASGKDKGLRVLAANPAAAAITGIGADELAGRRIDAALPGSGDSDLASALRRVARDGKAEVCAPIRIHCATGARRIAPRIHGLPSGELVITFADRTELEQRTTALEEARSRIDEMASRDPLTGLPNRGLLLDRISQAAAAVDTDGKKLAVCFLDLDQFREINEQHGRGVGDALIKAVSERLADTLPPQDSLARWGGDEMAVLLTGLGGITDAEGRLKQLLALIGAPFQIGARALEASACIGLTLYPDDIADPDTLLRHATQALYAAKQRGPGHWSFFDTKANDIASAHRRRLGQLESSLERNELRLKFQPIVDMRDGRVVGLEALLRWDHPDEGLLLPQSFLSTAEGSHLMRRLDLWMLDHALSQLHEWVKAGQDLGLNVNISSFSLTSEGFADVLGMLLAAYPIVPPERITIEVRESMALGDLDPMSVILRRISALGVQIALDDFGTGWSSLTCFRQLPVDQLKIDQRFVHDMLDDNENRRIVRAVIDLALAFDRQPIAEGVESEEQGADLLRLGCRLAQGFCIAEPMEAEQIGGWIRDWQPPARWREAEGDAPAKPPSNSAGHGA